MSKRRWDWTAASAVGSMAIGVAALVFTWISNANTWRRFEREWRPRPILSIDKADFDTLSGMLTFDIAATNHGKGLISSMHISVASLDTRLPTADTTEMAAATLPTDQLPSGELAAISSGLTLTYDTTNLRSRDHVYLHVRVLYTGAETGTTYYLEKVFYIKPYALAAVSNSESLGHDVIGSQHVYSGQLRSGVVVLENESQPDHMARRRATAWLYAHPPPVRLIGGSYGADQSASRLELVAARFTDAVADYAAADFANLELTFLLEPGSRSMPFGARDQSQHE
jgi:hypothetical protein